MKGKIRRLLAMALAVVMTVGMMPMNALADEIAVSDPIGIPGISTYANNSYTVNVGDETTILGSGSRYQTHSWSASSNDGGSVSFNSKNSQNVTVTGVKSGTVTITHTYGWSSETFTVNVKEKPVGQYILYYYALIPGQNADDTTAGAGDRNWFGIGETYISGVADPKTFNKESIGTVITSYTIGDVAEGKTLYPDLDYNRTTYKYAEKDSDNASKEGYYTVEPMRVTVADGANAGNNTYNNTASGYTYHFDHTCVLNENDIYTVNFKVIPPEGNSYVLGDYSQRVSAKTEENKLKRPNASEFPNITVDGIEYKFDGWYTDENCTNKANFDGTIDENTIYYAQYVPTEQVYEVQYYFDGELDDTLTKTLGPQPVETEITTYPNEAKPGYVLDHTENVPLKISADASENVIKVYYKNKPVTYTINYYWNNTTVKVADSVSRSGNVGDEVNEEWKTVEGYTPVDAEETEKTITLSEETKEINFYYYKNTTLTANGKTVIYDGKEQSVSGFTSSETSADFSEKSIAASGTGTNAGTYDVTFGDDVIGTVDNSKKYIVTETTDGKLTINKKTVTLKSATLSKPYDGTELTNGDAALEVEEGWVAGEGATYSFSNSVLMPNETKDNTFTYTVKDGTLEENYTINQSNGTLSITNREALYNVTVTANSYSGVYDGASHTAEGFVDQLEDGRIPVEADGRTYYVSGLTASKTGKNVSDSGAVNANGTAAVTDAAGNVVTNQFNVTTTSGILTINPRPLIITAGSDTKLYDGTELTKDEYVPEPFNAETNRGLVELEGQDVKVTISGGQTLVGESLNIITDVKILDKGNTDLTTNYNITLADGTLTVTDIDGDIKVDDGLVVTKVVNGETSGYELGDTVNFTITVKNIYDGNKTVTLTELPGVEFTEGTDDANVVVKAWRAITKFFSNNSGKSIDVDLTAGEETTRKVSYVITEDDIKAGGFENIVKASYDKDHTYEARAEVETVAAAGSLKVEKKHTAIVDKDGNPVKKPDLGGVITYEIIVTNNGNVTLTDVVVTDTKAVEFTGLDGGTENADGTVTFTRLEPNESKTLTATYTVTEEDIRAGEVLNVATATGTSPEGVPDPTPDPDDPDSQDTVDTEAPNPHLTLTKDVKGGAKYAYDFGDEIVYTITVLNDGNITLTDLVIEDELTGDTFTHIAKLVPGESVDLDTKSYTVAEKDVLFGKVVNEATGTGRTQIPDPEDPTKEMELVVDPATRSVFVNGPDSRLSINKTTEKTGKASLGEEIVYKIEVVNNGNVTINNITVEDVLTGDAGDNALMENDTLAPGEHREFEVRYTVTEADILAGKIVNTATISGDGPSGTTPEDSSEVELETDPVNVDYSVAKTIIDEKDEYAVGDTIEYQITVTSMANVTLENVVVKDQLENATGTVVFTELNGISVDDAEALEEAGISLNADNTVTIEKLAPNGEVTLNCEYVVTGADAALNTQANTRIKNVATVNADPVTPTDRPDEEEDEVETEVEDRYTLIIQYQYADGTVAAATYVDYLIEGDTYAVTSPTIEGYNSSYVAVTGTMPNKDVVITVVYSAPTTPGGGGGGDDTPDTPPTPPTPTTPDPIIVPDIPVPAGAVEIVIPTELVPVDDEEVPLQGAQIEVDEDGNVTVTPIDEEEIPLAGGENDDHACCILHFLLMLAALIIYSFYTDSMKKHQKKLAELKDELAGETLKKQLGITDDRQAKM